MIVDIIGGPYLGRNVEALAMGGRIAVIGLQGGRRGELDLGALMAKRGSVMSTALRARTVEDKSEIISGVRREVWPLVSAGRVRPVIHARLPMADAAQAHHLVESGDHIGKVLLVNQ